MHINYGSFWKSFVIAKFVECKTPCALQDCSWQQDISSLDSGPGTWELGNFSRGPQKTAANFSRNGHCPTSHDVIFAMWKAMCHTSYTMYVFFVPPCILFFKILSLFLKPWKAAPWNSYNLLVCWVHGKFAFGLGLHFGTRPIVMAHRVFDFWFLSSLIETLGMIRIKQNVWDLFLP